MATKTYKATSVASTGTNWKNVSHAYDDNDSTSYAYRDYYTTSACHINGFNITDLPSDAIINTVTAYFKAATENSYGYFAGYIMCDAKTSASEYIKQSIFLNGKQQVSAQYYSMSVSGDELTNFATSNGLYGGSAVELLKNLRLRWVGGSTDTYYCQCQVFDTYVTIDYTVPTYALDLKGKLDNGTENDNISNWGTADIYIKGSIVSSGVSDYYESYTSGTTYEVKNIVANSGYKYVGNSSYSGTLTSNTTIVLPFETKISCTITYNGNGATSGSVAAQSGYVGDSLTLRDNGFVKKCNVTYYSNENPNITDDSLDELQTSVSSATFLGWYTAAEGGTRVGGSGDSYTPSGDTTLYAHWSAAVTTPTPTRDGYTLLGWYTERSGGTKVADGGGSYTPSGSILLYAHWKINSTNMIYIGTKQPTFYIGTKQVQSIYLGMSLIYNIVLPTISYDNITTVENLLVPSGETSNTYTLPAANLENAEGNISYALYSDDECTTSVGIGITFDENTRQVTISNAAKDTVATQDTDKDGLAKFYVKATYESLSAIGEITLENYKVTATFSYLNKEDTYVDKITEVYYGTSVEEFANSITDFKLPENDEVCHYINNGWVDFYDKSTIKNVREDTTFVLSVSSEAHDLDPNIAGYEIKEPTCTEAGYTKGYCRYCAEQEDGYKGLIQVDSPATGHTDTNDDNICDVCGERIAEIVDSGMCGSNLTYNLDSNGVLTISGTGDMQDSSIGWDKDLIKSVVINDGVTSIGSEAFKNCTNLTSITIPDGVTSIGDYAFYGCKGLTSLTIGDSVMSIGKYAFCNCTGLTDITIPNNVTSIDWGAFSGCTSLTSITIPDSVTSIGNSAFYYCTKLTEVDFSACTDIPTLESSNVFSNTFGSLVIKVPSDLLDEWKVATNWSTYADKIVGV